MLGVVLVLALMAGVALWVIVRDRELAAMLWFVAWRLGVLLAVIGLGAWLFSLGGAALGFGVFLACMMAGGGTRTAG